MEYRLNEDVDGISYDAPDNVAHGAALATLILHEAATFTDGEVSVSLADWVQPLNRRDGLQSRLEAVERVRVAQHAAVQAMPVRGAAQASTGFLRVDVARAIAFGLRMADSAIRASCVPETRHFKPSLTPQQALKAASDLLAALEAVRANPLLTGLVSSNAATISERWTPAMHAARSGRAVHGVDGPEWQPYSPNEKTVADTVLTPGADPLACLVEYVRSVEREIAADHGPQRVNPATAAARSFFDHVIQHLGDDLAFRHVMSSWPLIQPFVRPVYDLAVLIYARPKVLQNTELKERKSWAKSHELRLANL